MKIKHMQDKCRKEYFVGRIAFLYRVIVAAVKVYYN